MSEIKDLLVGTITFSRINEYEYKVSMVDDVMRQAVDAVLEQATVTDVLNISPFKNMELQEKILERIIATRFILEHEDMVKNLEEKIITLHVVIEEVTYAIVIANKSSDLGGVIFTIRPM